MILKQQNYAASYIFINLNKQDRLTFLPFFSASADLFVKLNKLKNPVRQFRGNCGGPPRPLRRAFMPSFRVQCYESGIYTHIHTHTYIHTYTQRPAVIRAHRKGDARKTTLCSKSTFAIILGERCYIPLLYSSMEDLTFS